MTFNILTKIFNRTNKQQSVVHFDNNTRRKKLYLQKFIMWDNLSNSAGNISIESLNDSRNSSICENKRSTKKIEGVMPILIRHLNHCHSDLKIWGSPVNMITFIGIVRHIKEMTTKIFYEIEDDTGSVTGLHWLASKIATKEPMFKLNTYVRIYGRLQEQNGKKYVLILKMLPVMDLNELTSHLLEVTYIMLKREKISLANHESSNAMIDDTVMADDNVNGLTKEQVVIFKIIRSESDSINGIERNVLKTRVPKNVLSNLDNTIDFLISEGHIYTTLTDDHFKTT